MPLTVQDLLRLPKDIPGDLASLLQALYDQRYTGPITFNYRNGIPLTVQVPSPQIRLSTDDDATSSRKPVSLSA